MKNDFSPFKFQDKKISHNCRHYNRSYGFLTYLLFITN
jgi:hypothetical protein